MLTTSSPGFNNLIIASIAAKPDENATPYFAFSRLAKAFCKAVLVGLCVLEYSKPLFTPGLSCAYVDVWYMGCMTELYAGSIVCPP